MPSTREMRLRIRSIKNLSQVTKALETVSASKVRKAVQANEQTRAYAEGAWRLLLHLAGQTRRSGLHPLLGEREVIKNILVVMVSGDKGLAGSYNVNVVKETLKEMAGQDAHVKYVTIGRRGRDMMIRRRKDIVAEFSNLPTPPTFLDTSAIGQMAVDMFLQKEVDQVYIAYTDFKSMLSQEPVVKKLLPFGTDVAMDAHKTYGSVEHHHLVYSYEPGQEEILQDIIPDFTKIQVFQAILSSQASEQAARMIAMRNATNSANDLLAVLNVVYNKVRQTAITNEILDITGGAEALKSAES